MKQPDEQPDKQPHAAIIGLGRIAWRMEDDPLRAKPCTHVGGYLKHGCRIQAGCDVDEEARREFGKRYGVENLYDDYQQMLAEQRIDLLSITAYATERHEMVMAAIKQNIPAIFCEKALATSLEQADEMVAALANSKSTLVTGHMRRWASDYQAVKWMIDNETIGRVLSVNVLFSGSLIHTGTHAFDLLHWWFGAPLSAQGRVVSKAKKDQQSGYRYSDKKRADGGGVGRLLFANGVVATIEGQVKDYFIFEFDIVATKGRIRIGNDGLVLYRPAASERMSGFDELLPATLETPAPAYEGSAWDAAVAALLGNEQCLQVASTAKEARMALEMALAFYHSQQQGGIEVTFPLPRNGLSVPSR